MTIEVLCLLGGFLLSLYMGRVSIPRIILLSKRKRIFDHPGRRKVHTSPVSRLGGVSFFPAILIAFCLFEGIYWKFGGPMVPHLAMLEQCLFFCTGLVIIYSSGIWDDIIGLSYKHKFLFQFLAAAVMIFPETYINNFHGLFGLHQIPVWIAYPFTLIVVVALINAFNLIDGVDGLCSGLSILAFTTFVIEFWRMGDFTSALMASSVLGISLAFFLYNVFGKRLKIFMGDGGSMTLGYMAAFLGLRLYTQAHVQIPVLIEVTPVLLMSIVFIPMFDMMRLFIVRMCNHKSPFAADRNHIHHKFLDLGYTHIQSTVWIMVIQSTYILGNIFLAKYLNINVLFAIDIAGGVMLIKVLDLLVARKVG